MGLPIQLSGGPTLNGRTRLNSRASEFGRLTHLVARQALGNPPVLAFTATAGTRGQRRILESLGIPHARVVVTGVDRPNISFVRLAESDDAPRFELIVKLLSVMPDGRAMLFVPTVKIGNQLQAGLRSWGLDLPFYHARLGTANERELKRLYPRVAQITALASRRSYKADSVVFMRGDPGDALYGVVTGRVRISASGSGGKEGIGATPAVRMNALMAEFGVVASRGPGRRPPTSSRAGRTAHPASAWRPSCRSRPGNDRPARRRPG